MEELSNDKYPIGQFITKTIRLLVYVHLHMLVGGMLRSILSYTVGVP